MSTSNWQNISYNIQLVKLLNPRKILDIGVGFGRWGILFREFLEVWGDNNISGKWNRIIDGVEIFPDYIKSYHNYFYDNIYLVNALDFLRDTKEKYNLINMGDVVEHFEKADAVELISLALDKSDYVLINIPLGNNWQQGSVNGNDYERHLSQWVSGDFNIYKNRKIKIFEDVEMRKFAVILLSLNKIDLKQTYGKHFRKKSFLKNKLGLINLAEHIEKRNRK